MVFEFKGSITESRCDAEALRDPVKLKKERKKMIGAACVHFHDYEPTIEYFDTDLLDANDYVDMKILNAIGAGETTVSIDADHWEDHPDKFPSDEIGISKQANVKKPAKLDFVIILDISFG